MSASEKAWITVVLCAVTTFGIRAFGPVAVGSRTFGPRTSRVLALLPASLLAALVITETVIVDGHLDVDARLAGVAFAGVLLWRRVSVVWVVIGAAAFTALLRLVF
jgi:branched-subunit amino acid transport protein